MEKYHTNIYLFKKNRKKKIRLKKIDKTKNYLIEKHKPKRNSKKNKKNFTALNHI